jgi:uncharacterized protein YndB with AHSA1/START domain
LASRYGFLNTWLLDADRERVFEVVRDFEGWPEWWPGVEAVTLDGDGGMRQRWRSRLPYDVSFRARVERIEAPALIEGVVGDGALQGRGRCQLLETPEGATAVVFELEVETTKRWMNLLAPAARRLFEWNHDVLMRQGGEGIARRLGARLLAQV